MIEFRNNRRISVEGLITYLSDHDGQHSLKKISKYPIGMPSKPKTAMPSKLNKTGKA